jgi:rsbT co-antagonist protein RsbR
MVERQSRIPEILKKSEKELLADWLAELKSTGAATGTRISESELQMQAEEFLKLLQQATQGGNLQKLERTEWKSVLDFLDGISKSRALQGFTSEQTALFILSLKKPLFSLVRKDVGIDGEAFASEVWSISELIDRLSLQTIKTFQKSREEIIIRQQEEMLELSTPVVKLWDGVLALPMIGTLDSARTQVVMESLLQRIVETGSEIAIIDITGVPTVDTLVAQHLIKTVTAIRLMGADCIVSGIRPQIAQTIVHLGVDLQGVTTKSTLADALALAFKRLNVTVTKTKI